MNNPTWLERLQMLCDRHDHLNIGPDLSSFSEDDCRGIYFFLLRREDE